MPSFFGFGTDKKKSQTSSTQDTTSTQTAKSTATGSETSSQKQTASTLDAQAQELLKGLLTSIGGTSYAESKDTLQQLTDVVSNFAASSDSTAVVNAARASGEKSIERSTTELASSIGSSQNSLVQQLSQESQGQLEVQLAGLGSQLQSQNADQLVQMLSSIVSQQRSPLTEIVSLLKGATTTAAGTQETQTQQVTDALTKLVEHITGTSTTSSKDTGLKLGFSSK